MGVRVDLHCHSYHSACKHVAFLKPRDCYNKPLGLYRTAKARGMDLVTITDHDTIDGCLELLDRRPDITDFFIGEEVEAYFPDAPGRRVHIAVYDITEAQHGELQRLRPDVRAVVAYCRQQQIIYALNHLFWDYGQGPRGRGYLEQMLDLFDRFELGNGHQSARHHWLIARALASELAAGRPPKGVIGGSDAHTMGPLARTYTISPAADRAGFLADLRAGRTGAGGVDGGLATVNLQIYGVIFNYIKDLLLHRNGGGSLTGRIKELLFAAGAFPFSLWVPIVAAAVHQHRLSGRLRLAERDLLTT